VSEAGAGEGPPELIAYHGSLEGPARVGIEPAGRWRPWIEEATLRWPSRCLPLMVANQSGWALLTPMEVRATWDGSAGTDGLSVSAGAPFANSMFGYGILTFNIPYVLRTSPGWDLLYRGPANQPKDGISPLEGLVEADWIAAPTTMSWQLTRAGHEVVFGAGEPYCLVVPARRHDLESVQPRLVALARGDELAEEVQAHADKRAASARERLAARTLGYDDRRWDQDYFRGRTATGEEAPEHRTARRLAPFAAERDGQPR
jgi:hypothetical protein